MQLMTSSLEMAAESQKPLPRARLKFGGHASTFDAARRVGDVHDKLARTTKKEKEPFVASQRK